MFWLLGDEACGILAPGPGIEPTLPASKGYQHWDFFGRNDAKAETPVLWPPHEKS